MKFPWWGSVLLAIGFYFLIKYQLPGFLPEQYTDFLKLLAPLTAMGFLLLAAKQLYDDVPTAEQSEEDPPENDATNPEAK